MRILSRIAPRFAPFLQQVPGGPHQITLADSWPDLFQKARDEKPQLAFLDPDADPDCSQETLGSFLEEFPNLQIVIVTTLVPSSVEKMLGWAELGLIELVFPDHFDGMTRLAVLIASIEAGENPSKPKEPPIDRDPKPDH